MVVHKIHRLVFVLLVLVLFSAGSLTACSKNTTGASDKDLAMASMDNMPAEVKAAPPAVRQAYQFAAANPDIMKQIPCYCGCGAMGHTSNYSCYVKGIGDDGAITFDPHALGCSICVDITQDTARYLRQGKTIAEIKASVDQTYSKYGPSNLP